jgi:hypothetical protein
MVPEGMTSDGINREHGADDPNGAKTVAAPATVSGLPDVLVMLSLSVMPLRKLFVGRLMSGAYSQARRPAVKTVSTIPDGVVRRGASYDGF